MVAFSHHEMLLLLTEVAIGEDAVGQYTSIAHVDVRIEAMQTEALVAVGQLLNVPIGQYGGLNVIYGKVKKTYLLMNCKFKRWLFYPPMVMLKGPLGTSRRPPNFTSALNCPPALSCGSSTPSLMTKPLLVKLDATLLTLRLLMP